MMEKIQRSLKNSFRDGVFASIMTGLTEQYMTPCAVALHASVSAIGVLAACTNLIASGSQLFSTFWVHRFKSRRRFIVTAVILQACMLAPLAFLPLAPLGNRVGWFIFLAVLFASAGVISVPAWGSLMTDHVAAGGRGNYFGWRSHRLGLIGLAANFTAGLILNGTHPLHPLAGFTVLFLLAMSARFVSAYFISQMEDLPFSGTKEDEFTFWMFIRRFRQSNFVRFVIFVAAITLTTNIAGPFFSVYMLRDLQFNYLLFSSVWVAAAVMSLTGMRLWGLHADRVGNVKVLRLTSFFLPLIPLAWLVSSHPLYLVVVEACSGFIWGGFNLAASTFVYDAVSPGKRIRCIAYFNVINGTALAIGATIGGYLAMHLPGLRGYTLLTLFMISGILRFFVVIILGPTFKEVRPTTNVSNLKLFFSVIGVRPISTSPTSEDLGG